MVPKWQAIGRRRGRERAGGGERLEEGTHVKKDALAVEYVALVCTRAGQHYYRITADRTGRRALCAQICRMAWEGPRQ